MHSAWQPVADLHHLLSRMGPLHPPPPSSAGLVVWRGGTATRRAFGAASVHVSEDQSRHWLHAAEPSRWRGRRASASVCTWAPLARRNSSRALGVFAMPHTFTATGGASLGWTNATWPLAQLSATPDKLTISIRLLGTYSFAPDQVSAVERYVIIPVLGWGIRIHHCNADCPKRVIFWCLGSPNAVLEGIRGSGFLPLASISASPERHGIAMRWSAIVIAVVVWNALIFLGSGHTAHPGPFILAPLLFAFALTIGTLMSPKLQRIILKPGRSVGEIRPFLRLLAFISGFLLVIFSILLASGAFTNAPNNKSDVDKLGAKRRVICIPCLANDRGAVGPVGEGIVW